MTLGHHRAGSDDKGSRAIFGLPETMLDFPIALSLNLIFVALIALTLWPLGKSGLSLRLAKGYLVFWIVTVITGIALYRIQRMFRVDADTHADVYVLSNFLHGVVLLTGWSAFAALALHVSVAGMTTWSAIILWVVGFIASFVAFIVLTTFHKGSVYRLINVLASLLSFVVFALWPSSGRAIFGWFFNLF